MLPHDQRVAAEIVDIIHRLLRPEFEKEPADVRPEKALADVVRIVIVIDVFVVLAVVRTPIEGRILESTGAEEKGGQFDRGLRFEGEMGKETMVAEGDTETGGHVEKEEETDLEPIEPVVPDVEWHGGKGQGVDDGQENAGRPVDAIPRNA